MLFDFFNRKKKLRKEAFPQLSLCGHLEAIVGQYFLYGVGISDIETLYYDSTAGHHDAIATKKENIVAYFINNEKIAFVRRDMQSKLLNDTEGYNISFIPVESFEVECLNRETLEQISEYFNNWESILWVDDDFMNDENREFDFPAFEIIDSGTKYLNPRHFSLKQLISVLEAKEV